MARFSASLTSTAALAASTGFMWLRPSASGGGKLRRVTGGVIAGASTPTSQQVTIGMARTTNAGTTPTALTAQKFDPNSPAAACVPVSAYATPPTLTSPDFYALTFNTQSGFDLPFEQLEELVLGIGTTDGIAFINRTNALPSAHSYQLSIEWEE